MEPQKSTTVKIILPTVLDFFQEILWKTVKIVLLILKTSGNIRENRFHIGAKSPLEQENEMINKERENCWTDEQGGKKSKFSAKSGWALPGSLDLLLR